MPLEVKGDLIVPRSVGLYSLTPNQSSNISVGDHVKFSLSRFETGGNISLDTATAYVNTDNTDSIGRFLLTAGFTYKITAAVYTVCTAADLVSFEVYDVDAGVAVTGILAHNMTVSHTQHAAPPPLAVAFVTPSSDTRYEIRIAAQTSLSAIQSTANNNVTWVLIEQV